MNKLGFRVLPGLFEAGEQYVKDLAVEKEKAREKKARRAGGRLDRDERKTRPGKKMRDVNPW